MRTAKLHSLAFSALAAASACFISSCETTTTARVSTRALPVYEPPLARSDFQTVRTTAYTCSEADHLEYGARNALGGPLQSASVPRGRVEIARPAPRVAAADESDYMTIAYTTTSKRPASKAKRAKSARASRATPPRIGSAASDWSRWPAGTKFQVLSTGQIYRIDDYGWALAGRNTIDLYMGNRSDMNRWGVRQEKIKILQWGDPNQSIRVLEPRQTHKHIRRMVLELRGQDQEAAALN